MCRVLTFACLAGPRSVFERQSLIHICVEQLISRKHDKALTDYDIRNTFRPGQKTFHLSMNELTAKTLINFWLYEKLCKRHSLGLLK